MLGSTVPNRRALGSPDNLGQNLPSWGSKFGVLPNLGYRVLPSCQETVTHTQGAVEVPWGARGGGGCQPRGCPHQQCVQRDMEECTTEWTCRRDAPVSLLVSCLPASVSNNRLATQPADTTYCSITADTRCHLCRGTVHQEHALFRSNSATSQEDGYHFQEEETQTLKG